MIALRVAFAVTFSLTVAASAAPAVGERLPSTEVRTLDGKRANLTEMFAPAGTTLVVAIMDGDAAEPLRKWFDEAQTRGLGQKRGVSLLALDLPFFVGEKAAAKKAKARVPSRYWDDTALSAQGELQRALDLGEGETPWVFVVNPDGRVIARTRGSVDSPGAADIWRALATPLQEAP